MFRKALALSLLMSLGTFSRVAIAHDGAEHGVEHLAFGHRGAANPNEVNAAKIPEHGPRLGTGSKKPKPQRRFLGCAAQQAAGEDGQ